MIEVLATAVLRAILGVSDIILVEEGIKVQSENLPHRLPQSSTPRKFDLSSFSSN